MPRTVSHALGRDVTSTRCAHQRLRKVFRVSARHIPAILPDYTRLPVEPLYMRLGKGLLNIIPAPIKFVTKIGAAVIGIGLSIGVMARQESFAATGIVASTIGVCALPLYKKVCFLPQNSVIH